MRRAASFMSSDGGGERAMRRAASFMSDCGDTDHVYTLSRTASRPENRDDAASSVVDMRSLRSSKSESPERARSEDEGGAAAATPASGSAISFNVEASDGKHRWPTVRVRRPSKGAGQAEGNKDMLQPGSFRGRTLSAASQTVRRPRLVDSFKSLPSTPDRRRRNARAPGLHELTVGTTRAPRLPAGHATLRARTPTRAAWRLAQPCDRKSGLSTGSQRHLHHMDWLPLPDRRTSPAAVKGRPRSPRQAACAIWADPSSSAQTRSSRPSAAAAAAAAVGVGGRRRPSCRRW